MLGVPVEDRDRFTVWTSKATLGLASQFLPPETLAEVQAAGNSLAAYFEELIAGRRGRLSDDLLSALIRAEEAGDRLAPPELLSQAIGLLIAGFETTIGLIGNGVRALIRHPAELAKLALVFYLAAFLARRQEELHDLRRGVLPPLLVAGAFAALVFVQPDLGNCLTLVALTFGMLYLAGAPVRYLGWTLAPALPLLVLAIAVAPYRLRRITAFWDPWADPRGSGFQIIQSWLAFGNGGVLGQGVGASKQKLFYLPESHTDFIFAIIGEELGFVGAATVVALFAVLVWRGLRIGLRAPEPFGAYLALGITLLIATQTLVNLGVVLGLLPTKGLPLPFISFGGSALLVTMLSTGVLLNISQQANV